MCYAINMYMLCVGLRVSIFHIYMLIVAPCIGNTLYYITTKQSSLWYMFYLYYQTILELHKQHPFVYLSPLGYLQTRDHFRV